MESRITFRGRDREIEGYLRYPTVEEKGLPGIVVIHEIWGLEEHIEDVARRFAAEGYVAFAPDLYTGEWREVMSEERIAAGMAFLRGASQEVQRDPGKLESALADKPREERDATKMLATTMSPEGRLRFDVDLLGAVEYLKGRPGVDADRRSGASASAWEGRSPASSQPSRRSCGRPSSSTVVTRRSNVSQR